MCGDDSDAQMKSESCSTVGKLISHIFANFDARFNIDPPNPGPEPGPDPGPNPGPKSNLT